MYSVLLWILYYISDTLWIKGFYETGVFNIGFQNLGFKGQSFYFAFFIVMLVYSFLYSILIKFTISEFLEENKYITEVRKIIFPSIIIFIGKLIMLSISNYYMYRDDIRIGIGVLIFLIFSIILLIYIKFFILNMIDNGIEFLDKIDGKLIKKYILTMFVVLIIISIFFYNSFSGVSLNRELIFGAIVEISFLFFYIFIFELERNNVEKNIEFDIKNYIALIWFLILLIILPSFFYRQPSKDEIINKAKKYIEKKYNEDFIFEDSTNSWNSLEYKITFNHKNHIADDYYRASTHIDWYPFGILVNSGDSYSYVLERKEKNRNMKEIAREIFGDNIFAKQLDRTYSHLYILTNFDNFDIDLEKNKIFNFINILKDNGKFEKLELKICYLDERVLGLNGKSNDEIRIEYSRDQWSIEDSTQSQAQRYNEILNEKFSKIKKESYNERIENFILGSHLTYQKKLPTYTVYPEFTKYISFIKTTDMFNSTEKENLEKKGEFERYNYKSIDNILIYYSKNYCLDYNSTEFVKSATNNDFENLKKLFENGAFINSVDNDDKTALYWAKYNKNVEMIEYLLKKGATKQ